MAALFPCRSKLCGILHPHKLAVPSSASPDCLSPKPPHHNHRYLQLVLEGWMYHSGTHSGGVPTYINAYAAASLAAPYLPGYSNGEWDSAACRDTIPFC
jgi:hypothetical protein